MTKWQPIKTAPKDGTKIKVVCVDEGGKWWESDTAWWDESTERFENGSSYVEWPLTHWMHLTPETET